MWSFASNAIGGRAGSEIGPSILSHAVHADPESSDDEVSSSISKEEGLECPICCESFNIVENIPYVLWCGHTLCKNCVLGLQCAVVKFPSLLIQLPVLISCPWCHLLSLRIVSNDILKFPRKNFFVLWMLESKNGERVDSCCYSSDQQSGRPLNGRLVMGSSGSQQRFRSDRILPHTIDMNPTANYWNAERIHSSLRKSLAFFVNLTAKFPIVVILVLIVGYAIPASALILALYILVTVMFALPSVFILYFAYHSLDWIVREIVN